MRPFAMAAPNLKKYVGPFQFCCSSLYFYILTKFRLTSCVAMDKTNVSGLETFIPTEKKRSLRPGNARLQKYWTCEWRSHALPPTFTPMSLYAYCPALARRLWNERYTHFYDVIRIVPCARKTLVSFQPRPLCHASDIQARRSSVQALDRCLRSQNSDRLLKVQLYVLHLLVN